MTKAALDHDAIQITLARLEGVRQTGKDQWESLCPAHEDRHASLSVGRGKDGRALLHCHAGCALADVLAAIGLKETDLFPLDWEVDPPESQATANAERPGRIVETYDYHDTAGRLLSQSVRYEPKRFRQRRPDGNGGWIWNLKDTRRVLYRLPDLVSSDSNPVFIVEGEKDADRLAKGGLTATTNPGGAGKWRSDYNEALKGRDVVILPDNDEAGKKHAEKVAKALRLVAASIKIVQLPDLPDKGDISDWLDADHTVEDLQRLISETQPWSPGTEDRKETAEDDAKGGSHAQQLVELVHDEGIELFHNETGQTFARLEISGHLET